jgi:hypothetical protein
MTTVLDTNEIETNDIYFAAFLLISGCELVRERRQGQRVYFIFKNIGGSIQDLKRSYFTNEAKVNAHQYSQQIVAVKRLLFDNS